MTDGFNTSACMLDYSYSRVDRELDSGYTSIAYTTDEHDTYYIHVLASAKSNRIMFDYSDIGSVEMQFKSADDLLRYLDNVTFDMIIGDAEELHELFAQ